MMDLATIHYLSQKQARESAARRIVPMIIEEEDLNDHNSIRGIPNLGDRCPRGWKRIKLTEEFEPARYGVYMGDNRGYGAYFVDKGFGGDSGPAMSPDAFLARLKAGYGYAIVEEGEFQLKVGVFKKAE